MKLINRIDEQGRLMGLIWTDGVGQEDSHGLSYLGARNAYQEMGYNGL